MAVQAPISVGVIIGGEERPAAGDAWLDDLDPATATRFAVLARGTAEDIDAAAQSARAAQPAWAGLGAEGRSRVLRCLSDLIDRDRDSLSRLESQDVGKPLHEAIADVNMAASYFRFYGEAADKVYGESISLNGGFARVDRVPRGVTGHILPWNYPLALAGRTLAPSLAAGNACVLKPAEEAPLTAVALARLALEAGLPPGVLNVVPGLGEEAGAALAAHPEFDHVSFTGSREVGVKVARASAEHVRPVMLELGGKSPSVVLRDADVDRMVPVLRAAVLTNAGQTCSAGTRVLVEREIHKDLLEALMVDFGHLSVGPGLEDKDLGALISETQLSRVADYVSIGRREGNALVMGGGRLKDLDGYFFAPTIFDISDPTSRLAREEVFGPVLAVVPFSADDEAVRIANSTGYDLVAAVWTQDIDRAFHIAKQLQAGQVYVNNWGIGSGVNLPFGGFRGSGFGREKGFEALREYTVCKTTVVRVAPDR